MSAEAFLANAQAALKDSGRLLMLFPFADALLRGDRGIHRLVFILSV